MPSTAGSGSDTLPGRAIGTPSYMSPEQARGDLDALGRRSDVYSLGATLYCLLTGRPPFEADDLRAILQRVEKGDFSSPRQLDPAIDPALEAVCLKAMALNAADRYDSVRTLADDVNRWLADEPVTAWPEPWARQARRWVKHNRTVATAIAASMAVGLIGLATVSAVQRNANRALERSNQALKSSYDRERARFDLAMDSVKRFYTGVSEDFLLQEKEFSGLRVKLLSDAKESYAQVQKLLEGQTDRHSQTALAKALNEFAALNAIIGSTQEAIGAYQQSLKIRIVLADEPDADAESRAN